VAIRSLGSHALPDNATSEQTCVVCQASETTKSDQPLARRGPRELRFKQTSMNGAGSHGKVDWLDLSIIEIWSGRQVCKTDARPMCPIWSLQGIIPSLPDRVSRLVCGDSMS
jgi:hypothetical protein